MGTLSHRSAGPGTGAGASPAAENRMHPYDFAIIGGGIVRLSTGVALRQQYPKAQILILEEESSWADHQTGRNSDVT